MSRNTVAKRNSFLIRAMFFVGVMALAFITLAAVKANSKKREVQKEIDKLKAEAERIERENFDLAGKISYLESHDYQEKEAKDKLNLQNKEEQVVIIKPGTEKEPVVEEEKFPEKKLVVRVSNVQKWWDYFFKY